MRSAGRWGLWFALILCCLVSTFAQAVESRRLALLIGNDQYRHVPQLRKAGNDAAAMARALQGEGFEVSLHRDVGRRALLDAVGAFVGKVREGDEVVFFFAGHGVQLSAASYLLPVDLNVVSERQITEDAFALQSVIDDLKEARARFTLLIIDACRDNPLPKSGTRSIGLSRGLNPTLPPPGQMIIYSAGKGQQALDRLSNSDNHPNGLFTRIFLAQMKKGQEIREMLAEVQEQVEDIAKGIQHEQRPALYSELKLKDRYFLGRTQVASLSPVATAPSAPIVSIAPSAQKENPSAEAVRQRPPPALAEPQRLQDAITRRRQEARITQAAISNASRLPPTMSALPQEGKGFKDCDECPEMAVIPAGSFQMGSSRFDNEKPVHSVTISRPFALSRTEVTQGQWRAIMGSNPSRFKNCGDDCPVENVSWHEAKEFIRKLNDKTGKSYRLPTEAEWEYACRAGGNQEYCGSDDIDAVAWHKDNSGSETHAVAGRQANAFGLYDMIGNVSEWAEDCWNDANNAPTDGSAWTSGECVRRVVRGGSLFFSSQQIRSTRRYSFVATDQNFNNGLRPVRVLP